jgi:phosphatidylglycerophosphate synthase
VAVVTEDADADARRHDDARRAGRELVLEVVFRPPATALARVFARLGVAAPAVVLANALTGLVAAFALARGELVAAAVLLQLKTLLDNTDGQLARLTGRVTLVGRYLDTEADLVVNAAIFAALGHVTGEPLLAALSFAALVLVLAVDFNVTELYRQAHGHAIRPATRTGSGVERTLEWIYRATFGQLDRAIRGASRRRLRRIVESEQDPQRVANARLAYIDRRAVTVLANLGLSTQLLVLGICLVARAPGLYLWLTLVCLGVLVPLHVRAEIRARSALSTRRAA